MCRRLSLEWRFSNNNSYMINNLSHIVFHWCRDGEMMIHENRVKLLTDPFIFSESCDSIQISNPCKFKWSMMKLWNILFCFIFARPSDGQWQQWGGRITTKSPQSKMSGVRGEGTYNPKSAWMFVDSRRRVLPDIDGKKYWTARRAFLWVKLLRKS